MTSGRQLLTKMAEGYHSGKGVDTMTLCQITPAYSQRFGEWKLKDIRIDKIKNDDGHTYTYHLCTDPDSFDWDSLLDSKVRLRAAIPLRRKGRTGRKVEIVKTQEGLAL